MYSLYIYSELQTHRKVHYCRPSERSLIGGPAAPKDGSAQTQLCVLGCTRGFSAALPLCSDGSARARLSAKRVLNQPLRSDLQRCAQACQRLTPSPGASPPTRLPPTPLHRPTIQHRPRQLGQRFPQAGVTLTVPGDSPVGPQRVGGTRMARFRRVLRRAIPRRDGPTLALDTGRGRGRWLLRTLRSLSSRPSAEDPYRCATSSVDKTEDAEELSSCDNEDVEDVRRMRGGDKRMNDMAVAEVRQYERLNKSQQAKCDSDKEMRDFCMEAAEAAGAVLNPVAPVPPDAPKLAAAWLDTLRWPREAKLPDREKADLRAFAASVAAYADTAASPGWLGRWFPSANDGCTIGARFRSGSVVTSLLRWGSTLYVASAEPQARAWNAWVATLAAALVPVDAVALCDGRALPEGLPSRAAVLADAWEAVCKVRQAVLAHVQAFVDNISGAEKCVVFCGHSLGGAVAQLLAFAFSHRRQPDGKPVSASVVTFGCPSAGDAAFQELSLRLTRTVRYYVDNDPVPGLPAWACAGLRFSPAVDNTADAQAREHWALRDDGRARPGTGSAPVVPSLSVAALVFASHHSLQAYAWGLCRHWASASRDGTRLRRRQRREQRHGCGCVGSRCGCDGSRGGGSGGDGGGGSGANEVGRSTDSSPAVFGRRRSSSAMPPPTDRRPQSHPTPAARRWLPES